MQLDPDSFIMLAITSIVVRILILNRTIANSWRDRLDVCFLIVNRTGNSHKRAGNFTTTCA